MPTNASEIALPLRHAMATCRILLSCTFDKIKQKAGVKANNARKLMKRTVEQAGCNNFYKVLAYMSNINRPGQSTRVMDGTKLLANIHKAILVNNDL